MLVCKTTISIGVSVIFKSKFHRFLLFLFVTLLGISLGAAIFPVVFAADRNVEITSQADFEQGTLDGNLDTSRMPGSLALLGSPNIQDSTTAEFLRGFSPESDRLKSQVSTTGDGAVGINKTMVINQQTTPALSADYARRVLYLESTNQIYVSHSVSAGGLQLFDLDDFSTTTYRTSSSPSIVHNVVLQTTHVSSTNKLYLSTNGGGLSVIDLDDNSTSSYTTLTSPSLPSNQVFETFHDPATNKLYISTLGGLRVIDLDDNSATTYSTGSSPSIIDNRVLFSTLDSASNRLFVATQTGLSVIDLDDNSKTDYNTGSTPALPANWVFHVFLNPDSNTMYVSTTAGLAVIDLDTNASTVYGADTTPSIASSNVYKSWFDAAENKIYVGTTEGLSVINVNDNTSLTYSELSPLAIGGQEVRDFVLDSSRTHIYIANGETGVSILNLSAFNASAYFVGKPISLAAGTPTGISWTETKTTGQAISVQTRTADAAAFWENKFEDNLTTEVTDDPIGWGGTVTPSESGGVLSLSSPTTEDSYFSVDTGESADHFPVGSRIRGRFRINSDATGLGFCMFVDEWENSGYCAHKSNEWFEINTVSTQAFSRIGFELFYATGWNNGTDSFQIEDLSIEFPDSGWGAWGSACTDANGCAITSTTSGKSFLQYRLNLSTQDLSQTPLVHSVHLAAYPSQGTYLSSIQDMGSGRDWASFQTEQTVPVGTSIGYSFRSGTTSTITNSWSDWQSITGATIPSYQRYLQFKAQLTTTTSALSPFVSSIRLSTDETRPEVTWNDSFGNRQTFATIGSTNARTTDQLPSFVFTKASDSSAGILKYQVILSSDKRKIPPLVEQVYIDSIQPTRLNSSSIREDESKRVDYSGCNPSNCSSGSETDFDRISVRAKREQDKLTPGAYRYKVRAIDQAGNTVDTEEKTLLVNTMSAYFDAYPLQLKLLPPVDYSLKKEYVISSIKSSVYGIANSGAVVTLELRKNNQLVFSNSTTAQRSLFGIPVSKTSTLKPGRYEATLYAVDGRNYMMLPPFSLLLK